MLLTAVTHADEKPAITEAVVNGVPITTADIDRQVALALGKRPSAAELIPEIRNQARRVLIDRQLVLVYLERKSVLATAAEVDLAIERLKKDLAAREQSFDEYLAQRSLDEASLRKNLQWEISWQRFVGGYLNDATLERFFTKHRRHFDGTEMRVAHILFVVSPNSNQTDRDAIRRQAEDVHKQIQEGQTTFADAVKRFSAGPTRDSGGDIGFIRRREPMPESFTKAAFALEPDETSGPVETAFGFHLIHALEVRAGQKTWTDVRDELGLAVGEYLFHWAADQVRPTVQIVERTKAAATTGIEVAPNTPISPASRQ